MTEIEDQEVAEIAPEARKLIEDLTEVAGIENRVEVPEKIGTEITIEVEGRKVGGVEVGETKKTIDGLEEKKKVEGRTSVHLEGGMMTGIGTGIDGKTEKGVIEGRKFALERKSRLVRSECLHTYHQSCIYYFSFATEPLQFQLSNFSTNIPALLNFGPSGAR